MRPSQREARAEGLAAANETPAAPGVSGAGWEPGWAFNKYTGVCLLTLKNSDPNSYSACHAFIRMEEEQDGGV